jgi:ABC-type bacteriocin/lantibiotic exporter with double-glycine peptidase domain
LALEPCGAGLDTMDSMPAWLALAAILDLGVPYVAQQRNTCGAASLAMVMRFWDAPADPDEIARELLEPELRGILGSRLAGFARARGFQAIAYEGDLEHLKEYLAKGRPLIVAWKVGRERYHNVVVVGFDEASGEILVNDPDLGASRRVGVRAFEQRWAGAGYWTLLVLPAPP